MKHRYVIYGLIAAVALVVAACSNSDVAATVNETAITNEDVGELRTAPVGDTVNGEQFRGDLTTLIVAQSMFDAAEEDYGITGLDTEEGRQAYLAQAPQSELEILAAIDDNAALGEGATDVVTSQLAVRSAVSEELANDPETLLRVWQDQRDLLTSVCVRHIVVPDQAEAQAAYDRVAAGEPFSDVADDVSRDEISLGGQLGCPAHPTDYVEPFASVVATTEVGVVTQPFETEFGWHIVIVDERTLPASYDEFVADASRWVPEVVIQAAWSNWRDAALGRADIAVRSQIGRWFARGDGILPPPDSP
ncbi:MAG: peptidylprolyl isomerase [Acidimicrobiia bacterium]